MICRTSVSPVAPSGCPDVWSWLFAFSFFLCCRVLSVRPSHCTLQTPTGGAKDSNLSKLLSSLIISQKIENSQERNAQRIPLHCTCVYYFVVYRRMAATKSFDYSKWDNIELSDDESDLHPNIDKVQYRNRSSSYIVFIGVVVSYETSLAPREGGA